MGKIAFVFPGQGAQYTGMGQSLYEGSPAAKARFDQFEATRPGTLKMCFSGSVETLRNTRNTQPCIFVVSLAAAAALGEYGIRPEALAGFSLGEMTALTFGGAFSVEDGFSLVSQRGLYMGNAAREAPAAMAAVIKLSAEDVERLASQFSKIYPVNYNCPGQTVVAGDVTELSAFTQAVKEAGGRALPLKVSGGFHSPYMQKASAAFAKELAGREMGALAYPVYTNLTARPYAADIGGTLTLQMVRPVRWQETIENMISDGFTTFIELGPGKTLCGLIAKISTQVLVSHVEDMESLENTVTALREGEGISC